MKSLIIPGVIGLLCMTGGFWYGMKLMPKPAPKAKTAVVAKSTDASTPDAPTTVPDPINFETLEKTSQSMMELNDALRSREQALTQREEKIHNRESELDAERATLDASHQKFKTLFQEFQDRLQLVEANQSAQLQKQADLYASMGVDQSIDLIRAMDDAEMTRLFSTMEVKPLGKLIAAWKTKYPKDAARLLHVLDGMGQVMPKEKIALSDTPTSAPATDSTPTSASPTPDESSAPAPSAPAPDASASTPSSPGASATPPATTPDGNTNAPALTPPADSNPDTAPAPSPDATPATPKATTSTSTTASNF